LIYLCRHGQTEFNRDRRLQGRLDSPLTPKGARQAAAMAQLLKRRAPEPTSGGWRIISSPLGRALRTAGIIADFLGLPVGVDERLAEIALGEWEGRRAEDLGEGLRLRDDPEWFARAPGAETFAEVRQRVCAFLEEIDPEPLRRLIVVSHGVTGRVLRGVYAGLSKAQTLAQDAPQDAVFRLSAGRLERLPCAATHADL
jgi:probable phosphoglycerate mutase